MNVFLSYASFIYSDRIVQSAMIIDSYSLQFEEFVSLKNFLALHER